MKKIDEIKPHDFDGIQEYDNDLPRWWLGTFIITVLFGFCYWFIYHITGTGLTIKQELEIDLKANKQLIENSSNQNGNFTEEDLAAFISQPDNLMKAKETYMQNCVACHGAQGQGVIGPNLTDKAWIHGGKPQDIYTLIQTGVPTKGMPTWKGVLSDSQIRGLVAYTKSLADTNPPGAKAPEGNIE